MFYSHNMQKSKKQKEEESYNYLPAGDELEHCFSLLFERLLHVEIINDNNNIYGKQKCRK